MTSEELKRSVELWCPSQFRNEPFDYQVLRAFLHARACIVDTRRVLRGEQPIRPMTDYPEEP